MKTVFTFLLAVAMFAAIPTISSALEAWPDNEYTKLIPQPEVAGVSTTHERENEQNRSFTIYMAKDWTIDQSKAYAEKVKAMGFIYPIYEGAAFVTEDEKGYRYEALNKDKVRICITNKPGIVRTIVVDIRK